MRESLKGHSERNMKISMMVMMMVLVMEVRELVCQPVVEVWEVL